MVTKSTNKRINLALQGGGSHGALTWGVLDRLLDDERLQIAEISGTSAGAMNAVVLADGYERGGREGARVALRDFWKAVSEATRFSPIQRSPWNKAVGNYSLDLSPGYLFMEGLSRLFSPYELNPLGIDPLRTILEGQVNFDNVNVCKDISVHVTATQVRTGRARVFSRGAVTVDSVMASACLPQISRAVLIEGEEYWDGGYSGNPALMPLVLSKESTDILIIQINPVVRHETPRSAREIINRVNEISFNSSLIKELRAIHLMQQMIDAKGVDLGAIGRTNLHLIHTDPEVQSLSASSKSNAEWEYLAHLFDLGRSWADGWLDAHFDAIGNRSTLDLDTLFADPGVEVPERV